MPTVTKSIEVPASPAAVWSVVSDIPRFSEWNVPHMGFPDGPPPEAVEGATFKEKVRILNIGGDVDWTIASVKPDSELQFNGVGMMGVKIVQTYALEPSGDGTTVTASTEMQGAAFKAMFKAIEKSANDALEETLRKLSALAAS